jgi:hypothetical protein
VRSRTKDVAQASGSRHREDPVIEVNMDGTWNVNCATYTEGSNVRVGIPAAAFRGGAWSDGTRAGVFSLYLDFAPSFWNPDVGFRWVVPR